MCVNFPMLQHVIFNCMYRGFLDFWFGFDYDVLFLVWNMYLSVLISHMLARDLFTYKYLCFTNKFMHVREMPEIYC